jgi:guanyl-specific ribonuclease Sa
MHIQHEIPCQDACAYTTTAGNAIVIAVADGLGSAARSDTGAKLAVTSAFNFCITALESGSGEALLLEDAVRNSAAHARGELERYALEESCDLRDLGCTLIVIIAREGEFAVAHIGDGAVVGEIEGILSVVSNPGESEYTNEVVPLTSTRWRDSLRITSGASFISAIAVFTDGCQRAAFRKEEDALVPFERFFSPIFRYARMVADAAEGANEVAELLASPKLCEHSDDDKTLVVGVSEMD